MSIRKLKKKIKELEEQYNKNLKYNPYEERVKLGEMLLERAKNRNPPYNIYLSLTRLGWHSDDIVRIIIAKNIKDAWILEDSECKDTLPIKIGATNILKPQILLGLEDIQMKGHTLYSEEIGYIEKFRELRNRL